MHDRPIDTHDDVLPGCFRKGQRRNVGARVRAAGG